MRKIIYISGTRADYGLMTNALKTIQEHPGLELQIVATGMHLMNEFGYTIDCIREDGFNVVPINCIFEDDSKKSMSLFLGRLVQELTIHITKEKPDIILILGDRPEMLAAAIIGSYLSIPVVHLCGGEVSSTVDEHVRHALTKLANVHLVATKKSAKRVQKMGENPDRIHIVGAPGAHSIMNLDLLSKKELEQVFKLNLDEPLLIVLQHPVTTEFDSAQRQIKETLKAILSLEMQTIIIYPNADAGGREMIKEIDKYKDTPFISIYKNIDRKNFISLMSQADVLIGNSSSGIVETPSLKLPVVDIGSRQDGRERAKNVIECGYHEYEIIFSIKKALSKEFKDGINDCVSPYYREDTSKLICEILEKLKINNQLIQKKLVY